MLLFLCLLMVGLQVFILRVACDFQNDKRLLEEYNSKFFVLCCLIKGMFLHLGLGSRYERQMCCLVEDVNTDHRPENEIFFG